MTHQWCLIFWNNRYFSKPKIVDAFTGYILILQKVAEKPNQFVLKPLPYALDALEPVISAEIMAVHYGKHHQVFTLTCISSFYSEKIVSMRKNRTCLWWIIARFRWIIVSICHNICIHCENLIAMFSCDLFIACWSRFCQFQIFF